MKVDVTFVAYIITLCVCFTVSEQASSSSRKGRVRRKIEIPHERPLEERQEYQSPGIEDKKTSGNRSKWFRQAYPRESLQEFYNEQRGIKGGEFMNFQFPHPRISKASLPKYATRRSAVIAEGLLNRSAREAKESYLAHPTSEKHYEAHIIRARHEYAKAEDARMEAEEKQRQEERKQHLLQQGSHKKK